MTAFLVVNERGARDTTLITGKRRSLTVCVIFRTITNEKMSRRDRGKGGSPWKSN